MASTTLPSSRSSRGSQVRQLRALGGAIARVPNEATAYAHRDRRIMVNVAVLRQDMEEAAARRPWVDEFASALQEGVNRRAYVGFLGDEGTQRVRDAYPGPTWDRLAAIKMTYDPTNLFRRNPEHPTGPSMTRSSLRSWVLGPTEELTGAYDHHWHR